MTTADGAASMARAVEAFPRRAHAVLADGGVCFTDQPRCGNGVAATFRVRVLGRVRRAHGIARRLTKPCHPRTNGRAERMARTLKEATVRSPHYETGGRPGGAPAGLGGRPQPRQAPRGAPLEDAFQAVRDGWRRGPARFRADPRRPVAGPNT